MATRKSKSYFFGPPSGASGILFRTGNLPTQATYSKLFDSLPFINDAADTATETEAGHIRLQTDALVKTRAVPVAGAHALAVQGHQIPEIEIIQSDDAVHSIVSDTVTPVEKGGLLGLLYANVVGAITRYNFGLRINRANSVVIDANEKVALEGDEDKSGFAADMIWYYDHATTSRKWVTLSSLITAGNYLMLEHDTTTSSETAATTRTGLSSFDFATPIAAGTLVLSAGDEIVLTALFSVDALNLNGSWVAIGLGASAAGATLYGQIYDNNLDHEIEIKLKISMITSTSFKYKVYSKRFTSPSVEYPVYGTISSALENAYALVYNNVVGKTTSKLEFKVEQFKKS